MSGSLMAGDGHLQLPEILMNISGDVPFLTDTQHIPFPFATNTEGTQKYNFLPLHRLFSRG